jgi:hypothetical protein
VNDRQRADLGRRIEVILNEDFDRDDPVKMESATFRHVAVLTAWEDNWAVFTLSDGRTITGRDFMTAPLPWLKVSSH